MALHFGRFGSKPERVGEILGQVLPSSSLGLWITALATDPEVSVALEIGTWKGEGSTRCLVDAIESRKSGDPMSRLKVFSLEANKKMFQTAKKNHASSPRELKLLWGTIVDKDNLDSADLTEAEAQWFAKDLDSYAAAPVVYGKIPQKIDLLILDGGEFSTRAEMNLLESRISKWLVLDDIFTRKNRDVHSSLESGRYGSYRCVVKSNERNGYAVWLKG